MKKPQSDSPKMPLVWYSTIRGASNPDRDMERVYYGKVYRIPRDAVGDREAGEGGAIEERELSALEDEVINASCTDNGIPAVGEIFERYDVFDAETGDMLVMYRVPYKALDDKKRHPATVLTPLSKAARLARKRGVHSHLLATPPNAGQEARVLIGRLLRLLVKNAPDKTFKGPPSLAAEQRALALLTVAANELATMPRSSHRDAIVSQMGEWLRWLIDQSDTPPEMPETLSPKALQGLADQGIGTEIGPDEEVKDQ